MPVLRPTKQPDRQLSRRQLLNRGAASALALSLPIGLTACDLPATLRWTRREKTSGPDAILPLKNLFLDDGSGYLLLYLDVIGGLPAVGAKAPPLPLELMRFDELPDTSAWQASGALGWMLPYDFNKDRLIDFREMTQAWLIKAAEIRTGKSLPSWALKVFPQTAAISGPMSKAQSLEGLRISEREELGIRALLDSTPIGRQVVASVSKAIAETYYAVAPDRENDDD
jgi:hypothetical protein